MALRYFDGFDHYSTLSDRGWSTTGSGGGGGSPSINTGGGRFGGGAQLSASNTEAEIFRTIDDQSTWIIGWALKIAAAGDSGAIPIFQLTANDGTVQLRLYVYTQLGLFAIYRGPGTTWLAQTNYNVFPINQWVYLEFKGTIANSGGLAELRMNEVVVATYSGDTQQSGSVASAREIRFLGDRTQTGITTIDDVYMCDGTGGSYDDYLGDCRVQTVYPNGNGNSSVLVGSDGNSTDNYLLVDEASTPNDATDYVESSTPGDEDTYAYGNLSAASGSVHGIQIIPRARKTDAGTRSIVTVARHSGTEEDSAAMTLNTTWGYVGRDLRQTKPGGGAWSISDINAAEFGVKVNA